MLTILMGILAIVLTLMLVVGLHEAGHAMAARFFKVSIKRISIGFGKPLIRWKTAGGIEWVWAILPLGGYVQLLNSRIEPVAKKDYAHCFDKQPAYARIIILLSGVAANVLTAWIALILVFSIGIFHYPPQAQTVQEDSRAAEAGLQNGDRILAVAGQETPSWRQVGMRFIIAMGKKEAPVQVEDRAGQQRSLYFDLSGWSLQPGDESLFDSLGFQPDVSIKKQRLVACSFFDAVSWASSEVIEMLFFFLMMFKQLFTGKIPFAALLGPIGMFGISVSTFMEGVAVFMSFIATFSLAVALVNIFPIPGLDGGSILYTLIEKIRGKPMSVAMEVLLFRLAMIAFFVLLVNLLANDLQRYAQL